MPATITAIAASVAAAVAIAGTAYTMTQGPPGMPTGNAQAAGVLADAETLPLRRQLEAAAQQGIRIEKPGYTQISINDPKARDALNKLGKDYQFWTNDPKADPLAKDASLSYIKQAQDLVMNSPDGKVWLSPDGRIVPESERYADFRGLGEAQVKAKLAEEMAQIQLNLGQKYGKQFIDAAKAQQALADPEGTAARSKLYNLIEKQIHETPDRPVASTLDRQIEAQLKAGSGLDDTARSVLDDAVAKAQAARGQDGNGGADFAAPMTTGFEGDQRAMAANQKAMGWLSSGATPEDVAYRREQQDMANLSSFINGQTPESQFASLSGAQQGATPFYAGAPLSNVNPNAGAASQQFATSAWQTNLGYEASQTPSWMTGITAALGLGNAAAGAGFQPLASGTSSS